MKCFLFLLTTGFIFAAHANEGSALPVEIEITELTPKLGHVRVLSFFYDGKTCRVQTGSKSKKQEAAGRCKKILSALNNELKEKGTPSDFIHPKGSYWDVKLKTPSVKWQQTVEKEKPVLCDSSGKCQEQHVVAARTIAKTLVQEFVK